MRRRFLQCLCTLFVTCVLTNVEAQQGQLAPIPPASAAFATHGTIQQDDETDKEAIAKSLNEIHQRLKALEAGAGQLATDQESGTFTQRLSSLEDGAARSNEAIADIDESQGYFPRIGHGDASMKIFGRLNADYWTFPSQGADINALEGGVPQDRFVFRRMRIGVSGTVNDNMLYKIEMEFAGGINPGYRDAYLGWDHLPIFNRLLIGNQKRPYGLDSMNSSRYNVFMERPFAVEAFNQDSRRLGIASYGYSDDLRSNWRYGLFNQELIQNKSGYIGNNYQAELAGRYARTWWYDDCSGGRGYGHIGISSSYGSPDGLDPVNNQSRYRTRPEARSTFRWLNTGRIAGANEYLLGGIETVFNVGPLNITAEYQGSQVERLAFFGPSVQFHGGYAQAASFPYW